MKLEFVCRGGKTVRVEAPDDVARVMSYCETLNAECIGECVGCGDDDDRMRVSVPCDISAEAVRAVLSFCNTGSFGYEAIVTPEKTLEIVRAADFLNCAKGLLSACRLALPGLRDALAVPDVAALSKLAWPPAPATVHGLPDSLRSLVVHVAEQIPVFRWHELIKAAPALSILITALYVETAQFASSIRSTWNGALAECDRNAVVAIVRDAILRRLASATELLGKEGPRNEKAYAELKRVINARHSRERHLPIGQYDIEHVDTAYDRLPAYETHLGTYLGKCIESDWTYRCTRTSPTVEGDEETCTMCTKARLAFMFIESELRDRLHEYSIVWQTLCAQPVPSKSR